MKVRNAPAKRVFAICLLAASLAGMAVTGRAQQAPPPQNKPAAPQMSADEQKALVKFDQAPDLAAKLLAAEEFLKKYPQSSKRLDMARYLAGEIGKETDPAMLTAHSEKYLAIFTDAKESSLMQVMLIDTYSRSNRIEDAFKIAPAYLEKNPEDAPTLTQLALVGIDQAKRGNGKFVQPSMTYGVKAIALIEADKKPEEFDPTLWATYKREWLPQLYLSLGVASYMTGDKAGAKSRFDKAIALNNTDPMGFIMLGTMANEEYQGLADSYKSQMPGAAREETLKRANAKLDEVIDWYAHAVGLMVGDARYQSLHDTILGDLQAYYKYRHNNSTDGLQELINKYKKP